jgi:hypothetical protein
MVEAALKYVAPYVARHIELEELSVAVLAGWGVLPYLP